MTQLRTIRSAPPNAPTTRDNGDHWTTQAACANPQGIDAMHDAMNFPGSDLADKAAKDLCKRCNFKERCLTEYDVLVPDGVIGGLNGDERARRRNPNRPIRQKHVPFTTRERTQMTTAYEAGDSTDIIAERMGVPKQSVLKALKAAGVHIRNGSEAARLRRQRESVA